MGATNSRHDDAMLCLATPKHLKVGGRRLLDPSVKACTKCHTSFSLFKRRHYCRRCGAIICDACGVMKYYRARSAPPFRVCRTCDGLPIVHRVGTALWNRIMSFVGSIGYHRSIQSCRKAQLMVMLPFRTGASWDDFFTPGRFLARGANGAVYRACLKGDATKKAVAVKVVMKNTIFSLRKWHHITREIECLTRCQHSHIIRLIDTMQTQEAVYIVLQLALGGDLFDWLMASKAPSESEVRSIAHQLLSTLRYMHDVCNAVHRDIKPENILLEKKVGLMETPHILLGDFGFARVFPRNASELEASPSSEPTYLTAAPPTHDLDAVKATPCGTLGFAAPEILEAYSSRKEHMIREEAEMKRNPHSPRNASPKKAAPPPSASTSVTLMKKMDIFAAGVTICILLTGSEPFPCDSSKRHVQAVQAGPKFTGKQWVHVSPDAIELLRRMMQPLAENRPTAAECLNSKWFSATRATETFLTMPEVGDDVRSSFQMGLRSLRRNDVTMAVGDRFGNVVLRPRQEVLEDTLYDEPAVQTILRPVGGVASAAAAADSAIADDALWQ